MWLPTSAVQNFGLEEPHPTLEPAQTVVVDAAGKAVLSQLADLDGDDAPDEIVFQTALGAWNQEPNTPINLTYAGTTTNSAGGCNAVNVIRWNDPQNQIPGSFNCATGGILAQGGYCASGTGTFNGTVFDRIVGSIDLR